MKGKKVRLDQALVELGIAPSRERAKILILAGEVFVQGKRCLKPSYHINQEAMNTIELRRLESIPVGRGKDKIAPVLDQVQWQISGARCLDVGASTGGFTEALLERGAALVWAIDVGKNQLHERLARDPRVVVREGVNFRYFSAKLEGVIFDFGVMDVSFISIRLLLSPLYEALKPGARALVLFKPQFEVKRQKVGRKGIVRDPHAVEEALRDRCDDLRAHGFLILGIYPAALSGKGGNQEYFLHLEKPASFPSSNFTS